MSDPKAVKPAPAPKAASGTATVRVLPMGDGKISRGEFVELEQQYYAKGDVFEVATSIAKALEARGYVEIQ